MPRLIPGFFASVLALGLAVASAGPALAEPTPSPAPAQAPTPATPRVTPTATTAPKPSCPDLLGLRQQPTFPRAVLDLDSHNAFPTVGRLADGSLLLFYRVAKQHHNPNGPNPNYFVSAYSFDDGETWTKPEKVAFEGFTGDDGVEGVTVPKTGPLAGRPVITTSSHQDGVVFTRIAAAADCAGKNWAKPTTVQFSRAGIRSVPSSAPIQVSDSTFVLFAYHTPNHNVVAARLSYAEDGWTKEPTVIVAPDGPTSYSETTAAVVNWDGKPALLALLRNETHPSGQHVMGQALSTDEGRTWSPVTDAFAGYGQPQVVALADGRILASYRKAGDGSRPAMYRVFTEANWSAEQEWGPAQRQMAYGWLLPTVGKDKDRVLVGVWGKEDTDYIATIRRTTLKP